MTQLLRHANATPFPLFRPCDFRPSIDSPERLHPKFIQAPSLDIGSFDQTPRLQCPSATLHRSSTHPEATAVLAPVILRRQAMLICRTCLHYKSNLDRAGAVLRLPSPFPLSTRMVLFHILRVTLVSALWFTSVSAHCTNPKVRKEWRNLCADERAAWINAVKVLLLFTWVLSALAQITPVSCQHAAQPKCRCDCRPGDFIDPAYDFKQFCLRR